MHDHGQAKPCKCNHDDEKDGQSGGKPGDWTQFLPGNLGQGGAPSSGGCPKNDQVVNGARETDARDNPNQAGGIPELRRQHRARAALRP